jgi:hypothetical protein
VKFHSRAPKKMAEERDKKKNQEDKKQNLRDSRGCYGDSRKSENRRNQSDDEKSERPPQHTSPLKKASLFHAGRRAIAVPFAVEICMS